MYVKILGNAIGDLERGELSLEEIGEVAGRLARVGSSGKRSSVKIVRRGSVGLSGSYGTRRRRGSGERFALGMASFSVTGATGSEGVMIGSGKPDRRRGRVSRAGPSVPSRVLGLRERCSPIRRADTIGYHQTKCK